MERGLYAAATAMNAQQTMQDIIAQNLANATTAGYKQDVPTFQALQSMMLNRVVNGSTVPVGQLGTGSEMGQTYTDFQQGPMEATNNPLDIGLPQGNFLSVQTASGTKYTDAGALTLDGNGDLTTLSGQPILDSAGRTINVGKATDVAINAAGQVTAQGKPVAQLSIVAIPLTQLSKQGDSLFNAPAGSAKQVASPHVYPKILEQSNVNVAQSLIEMIIVERSFETAQKAVTSQDSLLQKATSDVGKV